jgi:hypothetical protein
VRSVVINEDDSGYEVQLHSGMMLMYRDQVALCLGKSVDNVSYVLVNGKVEKWFDFVYFKKSTKLLVIR